MFVMNVSLSDARGSGAGDLTSFVVWGFIHGYLTHLVIHLSQPSSMLLEV